jgi:hypothetical protein
MHFDVKKRGELDVMKLPLSQGMNYPVADLFVGYLTLCILCIDY